MSPLEDKNIHVMIPLAIYFNDGYKSRFYEHLKELHFLNYLFIPELRKFFLAVT